MNEPDLVVGAAPIKRLNLRNGARLRLEVTPEEGDRLLLRMLVMIPMDRWKAVELDRRDCENEEEMWLAILELANARLCDLADAAEMENGK